MACKILQDDKSVAYFETGYKTLEYDRTMSMKKDLVLK
jgi:hypothetical protein